MLYEIIKYMLLMVYLMLLLSNTDKQIVGVTVYCMLTWGGLAW